MKLAPLLLALALNAHAQTDASLYLASGQHEARLTQTFSGNAEALSWRLAPELWAREHGPTEARLARAELAWAGERWQVRGGLLRFEWAATDTVSPADLLNPRDWRDPTRPRKLALPALSLRHDAAGHGWEFVASPGGEATRLPDARFAPPLPAGWRLDSTHVGHQPQAALRWSGQQGGTEWSALAYHGRSSAPQAGLADLNLGPEGVVIHPVQDRLNALAATITRPLGAGSLLRAEAAWLHQRRFDSRLAWSVSVDHEFFGLAGSDDSLYVLLQTQGSQLLRHGEAELPGWWDLRRVLDRRLLTRWQYRPGEDSPWQISLDATLRPRGGDQFLRLAVKRRWSQGAELELGTQRISGQPGSFWGQYRSRDQAYLGLTLRR